MSDPAHTVHIDRIVLTDLAVTPDRAERIQALLEVELQRLLAQQGFTDNLTGRDVPHLEVPTTHLAEPLDDRQLAQGVAQSIAQALGGVD